VGFIEFVLIAAGIDIDGGRVLRFFETPGWLSSFFIELCLTKDAEALPLVSFIALSTSGDLEKKLPMPACFISFHARPYNYLGNSKFESFKWLGYFLSMTSTHIYIKLKLNYNYFQSYEIYIIYI